MKYTAFHKHEILGDSTFPTGDIILQNIISAAKRGKITEAGKKLLLVPDTRFGMKDISGKMLMKPVKMKECLPLSRLLRK